MHPFHDSLDTMNTYLRNRVKYYGDDPLQAFNDLSERVETDLDYDELHKDCASQDEVESARLDGEENLDYARSIFAKEKAILYDALKCPESGDLTLDRSTVQTIRKILSRIEAALV